MVPLRKKILDLKLADYHNDLDKKIVSELQNLFVKLQVLLFKLH